MTGTSWPNIFPVPAYPENDPLTRCPTLMQRRSQPWRYAVAALVFVLMAATARPVTAQSTDATAGGEECAPDLSQDFFADALFDDTLADTARTEAEQRVADLIAQDGIHVVHFWAPWCGNSIAELREGWDTVVNANEDVSFTFVTIWNDGNSGMDKLSAYDLPGRVLELTQPDYGPSNDKSLRRRAFLGLPVTWIPSTWIFHKNGELAFALNYGEMPMATLQHLIDVTRADW